MPSSKKSNARILCVNCNLGVNNKNTTRRFRILDLEPRVCALLCKWMHPMIVTDKHFVCQACWQLAAIGVNLTLQQDEPRVELSNFVQPTTAQPNVCLLCRRKLKWQNEVILRENPTELQQLIIKIIENKVAPQQITPSDQVCHPCWVLTQRAARRHNLTDSVTSSEETLQYDQLINQQETHQYEQLINQEETQQYEQLVNQEDPNQYVIDTQIILPDFRRARNSRHYCVFSECTNTRISRISDEVRAKMLQRYKFYLPHLTRVCYEHLSSDCWDNFNDEFVKSVKTFNAQQVEHVFSLVNPLNSTFD